MSQLLDLLVSHQLSEPLFLRVILLSVCIWISPSAATAISCKTNDHLTKIVDNSTGKAAQSKVKSADFGIN